MDRRKYHDLLLVIDMQNVYTKGQKWECLNTEGAADNVNLLISQNICADVIFTRFIASDTPHGIWKNYNIQNEKINSDKWANEMLPQLSDALKKYPLYTKGVYSSLAIPEVLAAAKKADRVVIAGVVEECCVLSTVFSLIDAGIYIVYLTDAVSGLDNEKEQAARLVLSGLSPLHLSIMTVKEYMASVR